MEVKDNIIEYNIPVTKENYCMAMITAVGCFIKTTSFEKRILSTMLNWGILYLTEGNREKLRTELNKSSFNLNNYIKKMKDKGIFIYEENILMVNPTIIKIIESGKIHLNFTIQQ